MPTCAVERSGRPSRCPTTRSGTGCAAAAAAGDRRGFDAEAYKGRNTVERAINKLKEHRAVAMRTDKRGYIFTGTIAVAAIRVWLCDLTRQDRPDRP